MLELDVSCSDWLFDSTANHILASSLGIARFLYSEQLHRENQIHGLVAFAEIGPSFSPTASEHVLPIPTALVRPKRECYLVFVPPVFHVGANDTARSR